MSGTASRNRLLAVGWLLVLAAACSDGATNLDRAREAAEYDDRTRAVGFYQMHLEENPDDFDVRLEYTLLLGEVWAFQGGDAAPILESLELLYATDPANDRVRELLSMMLIREGQAATEARRFAEAESFYLRAGDVNPDVGTANYRLGLLYAETDRGEEAFRAWIAAALKRPQIPDLYLRLGREYLARDLVDRAVNTLLLVDELRGTSTYLVPEANCALAHAYARRGDMPTANERYAAADDSCAAPKLGNR